MSSAKKSIPYTVVNLTRLLEEKANHIDRAEMAALLVQRNPARSLRYLYDQVLLGERKTSDDI